MTLQYLVHSTQPDRKIEGLAQVLEHRNLSKLQDLLEEALSADIRTWEESREGLQEKVILVAESSGRNLQEELCAVLSVQQEQQRSAELSFRSSGVHNQDGCMATSADRKSDCIVRLKLNAQNVPVKDKKQATQWLTGMLSNTVVKDKLTHAMPYGKAPNQCIKVCFIGLTDTEYSTEVEPKFGAVARVAKLGEDQETIQREIDQKFKNKKQRQAEEIGSNFQGVTKLLGDVTAMHGSGGKSSKRRKFARKTGAAFRTCQRVASAGLREAASSSSDSDDECE